MNAQFTHFDVHPPAIDSLFNVMFVLLEHDAPDGVHWDFMFEVADQERLRAWRLARNPIQITEPIVAEALGDHRLAYLEYEGPISNGRGRVRRIDRGACDVLVVSEFEVRTILEGDLLRGTYVIRRIGEESRFLFDATARKRTQGNGTDNDP